MGKIRKQLDNSFKIKWKNSHQLLVLDAFAFTAIAVCCVAVI
jgi:hypothetical protein